MPKPVFDLKEADWFAGKPPSMATDPTKKVPAEVWARIFGALQPRFRSDRQQPAQNQTLITNQCCFWQLPSVCKASQTIFRRHPELCTQICIVDYMLHKAELSLLAWLRAQSTVLTSLQVISTHTQSYQCLLALSDDDCPLQFASVGVASQAVINSLGTFGGLTTCSLTGPSNELGSPNLDLSPLQWLEPLRSLRLVSGRFTHVNAVSRLTCLEVIDARVTSSSNCTFCSSLVKLQLGKANISIHARGLCACTALQVLKMGHNCIIHALDASIDTLGGNREPIKNMFPASISSLTAMTNLSLAFFSNFRAHVNFAGISLLSNLQALGLEAVGDFDVHPEVGDLTKLTKLYLDANTYTGYGDKGCIYFSLSWESLLALQSLSVLSYFACDESVYGLAELEHLDSVNFVEAEPVDSVSHDCLAILKQRLNCRTLKPKKLYWPAVQ